MSLMGQNEPSGPRTAAQERTSMARGGSVLTRREIAMAHAICRDIERLAADVPY
jgi:hypothetical protein